MLNKVQAVELQEKLIIIYKYLSQKKLLKKFFLQDLDSELFSRNLDGNPQVNKLVGMENAAAFLEESIMALEEIKKKSFDYDGDEDATVEEIINKINIDYLCKKYGLKDCQEIEKLKLSHLLEAI